MKLGNGSRFVHVYVSILKLGMSAIITGSISSCLHTHIHTLTHKHTHTFKQILMFHSLSPSSPLLNQGGANHFVSFLLPLSPLFPPLQCHNIILLYFSKLPRTSHLSLFFRHLSAKVSPRMSGRRNENLVPDYPPNNRVSAREAVRNINTASGDTHTRTNTRTHCSTSSEFMCLYS